MPVHKILFTDTKFRPIPTGKYQARLTEVREGEIGKYSQERFTLVFEVVGGEYDGSYCNCFVNTSKDGFYGTGNKMGKIFSALIGKVKKDDHIDIYGLKGKECIIFVKQEVRKKLICRITKFERIDKHDI